MAQPVSYHLITKNSVTVFHAGRSKTVYQQDPQYAAVYKQAVSAEYQEAMDAADMETAVNSHFDNQGGDYHVENGVVYFRGTKLRSELNDRVVNMVAQNHDMSVMTNFLAKLVKNPSSRVQEQLYSFLQANDLPMMEDGRVMMFKRIKNDWTDCWSGTINNSIGNVISVERHEVDDDPSRTCSHGLHVCSIEYLAHFGGERLIGVAVDPADVVAIPYDYNNSKVRVCKYEVINELPLEVCESQISPWNSAVVDDDGYDPDHVCVEDPYEDEDEDDNECEEPYDEDEEDDDEEETVEERKPMHGDPGLEPAGTPVHLPETNEVEAHKPKTLLAKLQAWVRN
jgi:hypothetical protein